MKPSNFSAPLKKITPILVNGIPEVPSEILEQGIKTWSDHLVGCFVEKSLSIRLVKNALQQLWNNINGFNIASDGELYYINLADVSDKQKILEKGPIFIAGRIFIIRQWTVVMYPLCQDEATAKKKQLNYAKICVEIQVNDKFPTSLTVGMESGKNAIIGVDYQWVPSTCSSCNQFGHSDAMCTTKMSSEVISKQKISTTVIGEPTMEIGETSCVPTQEEVLYVGLGTTTEVSICSSNVELQEQILGEEVLKFSLEQVNDEIVVESVSSGVVILDQPSLQSALSYANADNDEARNEWTTVVKTK
ncbi:hypothetical protein FRX31_020255 [Thalictrum thalictroides]|uniref:DUF4283 domain-containing protein n=1 Tax=Thalictrum thalictroides TaxID=46969 RepID=A0A7J6W063_THATH|nr:hypothetical protein FRX31_020255 [Thalictrum thalictroides]